MQYWAFCPPLIPKVLKSHVVNINWIKNTEQKGYSNFSINLG